jgi:hypothetical protein
MEQERIFQSEQALQVMEIQGENSIESKKLMNIHRSNIRSLQRIQRQRDEKRAKK